jgi:hypothetical protein
MKVTYLDRVILPGPFVEYRLDWPEALPQARYPLTFNQRNHLAAFAGSERSTWIGGSARLPEGHPEGAAVGDLVASLIDGADALRTVAVGDGPDAAQALYPAGAVSVRRGPVLDATPSAAELGRLIDSRCRPGAVPGLFFARAGESLVFAVDHFHADMLSIDLLERRIHGERPGPTGFTDTLTAPEEPDSGQARRALAVWRRFLAGTGNAIPDFPVDLGVSGTGPVAPVHDVRHLVDAEDITGDLDKRTFAVLLCALAAATEPFSGTPDFRVIIPVHTRGGRSDPRRHTVGWMVSNAPVVARAGDPDATVTWLRDAVTVAGLPLESMITELHPVLPRGAVPMVSYMDFRGQGPALPGATYFSSVSPTDTAQFWFSRDRSGISLRAKYPDTAESREVTGRILDDLGARLIPGHRRHQDR